MSPRATKADRHDQGIAAQAGPAIPNLIVEVLPGNTVNSPAIDTTELGSIPHQEGEQFEAEGPTAVALVQAGHVKIVGSVEPEPA